MPSHSDLILKQMEVKATTPDALISRTFADLRVSFPHLRRHKFPCACEEVQLSVSQHKGRVVLIMHLQVLLLNGPSALLSQ